MESLQKHKQDFTVISNLWHKNARGAHGGTVVYLTGADAHGPTARNTVSCDQLAARYMGNETRYASIQVTTREKGGGHGGGSSLSWHENGTSMSGVAEPFRLYNMLFGGQGTPYEQRLAELQNEKSVLDAYVGNISSLNRNASKLDRERLDHYFQSLREVEQRIAREKLWARKPKPRVDYKLPAAELDGVQEITAMYDLILLAMQTDLSRVITYRQPIVSLLQALDIKYSAHAISHYQKGEDLKRAMIVRERKQTELFASFIDRLKATKDVDGSRLFDNCLVSYGSNLRAGHMLKNVPGICDRQRVRQTPTRSPRQNASGNDTLQFVVDSPADIESTGKTVRRQQRCFERPVCLVEQPIGRCFVSQMLNANPDVKVI